MPHVVACPEDGAAAEEAFSRAQRRTLVLIQESRALLDGVCAAHASGRFELLYPEGVCEPGTLRDLGARGRHSRSSSRSGVRRSDLRVLALPGDVGGGSREAQAVLGQMLCARLNECASHMDRLHARVCERTSRVLVTGDVNAGKSTFVNALLKRVMLPMDQQPCTQSFCEVVHVAPTMPCIVHAIASLETYRAEDTGTHDVLSLAEMQALVQNEDAVYQAFRVHLPSCHGLFDCVPMAPMPSVNHPSNGGMSFTAPSMQDHVYLERMTDTLTNLNIPKAESVLDVSVIDSPGLNSDLAKTMALFAKQDDIDVVVFVVNAANHLTLSARDFLEAAGREKALVFVIVNRFDEIRNRERCMRTVLEQVRSVLPRTYDLRDSLVHFVSARHALSVRTESQNLTAYAETATAVPFSIDMLASSRASGELAKCTAECEHCAAFYRVERSLYEFLLQRRAAAKLEPAQTFVANVLTELDGVIAHTRDRRAADLAAVAHELGVIAPCHDELVAAQGPLRADVRRVTEDRVSRIAHDAYACLAVLGVADCVCSVPWTGILGAGNFVRACNAAADAALTSCWAECLVSAAASVSAGHHELHAAACAYARHVVEPAEGTDTDAFFDAAGIRAALAIPGPSLPVMCFGAREALCALWSAITRRAGRLGAIAGASAALAATRGAGTVHLLGRLVLWLPRPASGRAFGVMAAVLVAGAAAFCAHVLGREAEGALRAQVRAHYAAAESSDGWRRDASARLGSVAELLLAEHRECLVTRFDAALHRQRELRAAKDVQRAQIDAALQYLDGRRAAIRQLLRQPSLDLI